MTGLILPASLALAAVAPGGHATKAPAIHGADAPTPAHARAYERVYAQVAREFGPRTPGRNIIKDGFAPHQPATDAETVASIAVLTRMLAPSPAPSYSTKQIASSTSTASPQVSSGGGGLPSCASESGGNYSTGASNTNASSGATGRYQITPSTAANYGCNLSTAGGQDACAQTIYAHQGASAWVGCGG